MRRRPWLTGAAAALAVALVAGACGGGGGNKKASSTGAPTFPAGSTMATRRCRLPVRAAACLRLPADSLSPGASPAQAASRAAVAKRAMSPPVSATITSAVRRPIPGMVSSRAVSAANGAAAPAASSSSSAILAVRWS